MLENGMNKFIFFKLIINKRHIVSNFTQKQIMKIKHIVHDIYSVYIFLTNLQVIFCEYN